jgi:peptide methionine sulfoxide reductase MsrB
LKANEEKGFKMSRQVVRVGWQFVAAIGVFAASCQSTLAAGDFDFSIGSGTEYPYYNSYMTVAVECPSYGDDASGQAFKNYTGDDDLDTDTGWSGFVSATDPGLNAHAQGEHFSSVRFEDAADSIGAAVDINSHISLDDPCDLAVADGGQGAKQIATAAPNFAIGGGYTLESHLRLRSLFGISGAGDEDTGWMEAKSRNSYFNAIYRPAGNQWERTWVLQKAGMAAESGNDTVSATSAFDTTKLATEAMTNANGFMVRAWATAEQELKLVAPGSKSIHVTGWAEVKLDH